MRIHVVCEIVFVWLLLTGPFDEIVGQEPRFEACKLPQEIVDDCKFLQPEYVQFVPQDLKASEKLPLVVFLHGAGGRGDDVNRMGRIASGSLRYLQKNASEPFLFVAPQCSRGTKAEMGIWQAKDLDRWLEHVRKELPVDAKRIYLTGNSMGGYGSWMWSAESPKAFAAVAPIVGGLGPGGPKDVSPDLNQWAENLKDTPIWAFHGALDKVVPAERSERMIKLLKEAGSSKAKLTIFPEEGHGASSKVYATNAMAKWMFSQQRPK